ncbi:MAG: hypothetical protein ACE5FK_02455 [Candidatus Methylomirabilia bacterium]
MGQRADVEVAAGPPGIPAAGLAVVHPFQPAPGFARQLEQMLRQLTALRNSRLWGTHEDTFYVSPMFLNELTLA